MRLPTQGDRPVIPGSAAARAVHDPDATIAIGDYGTGPDAAERNQAALAVHAALASSAGKVRMLGSAAADLALVADATLDASLTLGNRPWDMAAGAARRHPHGRGRQPLHPRAHSRRSSRRLNWPTRFSA